MKKNVIVMLSGFCLDMLFGDPSNNVHPVCGIGFLISKTERILRNHFDKTKKEEKKAVREMGCFFYGNSTLLVYACYEIT